MTEHALNILHQIFLNVILGVVPCDPEDGDTREDVFAEYLAETVTSMVEHEDITAADALYGVAEICHILWKNEEEKKKKDAT